MTDRFHSLTVALDHDMRADDAEVLMDAIRCLRWVVGVTGNVVGLDLWTAEMRVRSELRIKLFEALK